jgi:hypothetical protein
MPAEERKERKGGVLIFGSCPYCGTGYLAPWAPGFPKPIFFRRGKILGPDGKPLRRRRR